MEGGRVLLICYLVKKKNDGEIEMKEKVMKVKREAHK